ncbi:MAG: tetratricopeptide repeat protein [Calditrichaeota bacterium]|nr:MAG: tetratricopeptide repeat protein [Calditrichota bacterium]
MKRVLTLILFFSFLVIGCGDKKADSTTSTEGQNLTPEQKIEEATKLVGANKSTQAIVLLTEVMGNNPSEENGANAAFALGKIYREQNKPNQAVKYYKTLVEKYPKSDKVKEGIFMLGYLHANALDDKDKATHFYEEFLKNYPDDELAASVKFELDYLGKNIQDIDLFKDSQKSSGK